MILRELMSEEAYIMYNIAIQLAHFDPQFKFDEVDTEYSTRVVPLTEEFMQSYNDVNRPLLDCINEFMRTVLEVKNV